MYHLKPVTEHHLAKRSKQAPISVVVLTYNEELNLPSCLESLNNWVQEIFVVDSGSEDQTVAIAQKYTEHVYTHEFVSQAQQFNWALDNLPLKADWVMRLDADEFILPELRDEIIEVLPELSPKVTGLYIKRRVYFKGHWIRYGGYYPTWLLRLFRRGEARSEEIEMDEHIVILSGCTQKLKHDFVDDNHKGLSFWLYKHDQFAIREARMLYQREKLRKEMTRLDGQPARKRWLKTNVYAQMPLFFRALIYFLYRYFIRLGFLDGTPGLVFHFLQGFWYRFYVDVKIWESEDIPSR